MTLDPQSILNGALQQPDGAVVSGVRTRTAQIIAAKDCQQAYEQRFILDVAMCDQTEVFDTCARLRKAFGKDFSVLEFKRRVKVERMRMDAALQTNGNGDWRSQLLRTDEGGVKSCYENAALLLENDPTISGVLGYNEFTGGIEILRTAPDPISARPGEEIEDRFDTEVTRWLERRGIMVKPDVVRRVVDSTSREHPFHPVRKFLESLPPWDAKPRIDSWLIDYCGVESSDSNPNQYAMAIGSKFLISAVARVMQPGCKADHLLILEGPQGIGKSTAVRILAGEEWFSDQLADMGSKDASMQLRGCWILEMSELDVLSRAESARAKHFISQQTERFRLPYGKRVVSMPRQCVFIGTTNHDAWLKDETGGRRFWPVKCGAIDLEALRRDREQIWAEALARYRAGEHWWLEDAEVIKAANDEQSSRHTQDPWQEQVMEYAEDESGKPMLNPRESVSIAEILSRLNIPMEKRDQIAANRVARCLRIGGWHRYQAVDENGARSWRYRMGKRWDVAAR